MAGPGGANQIARRVIDDLTKFSGETLVDDYMSFFKSQQITKSHSFINWMREEANTSRNLVRQLNALIAKMEALEDQGELFNTLMELGTIERLHRLSSLVYLVKICVFLNVYLKSLKGLNFKWFLYGSILNILQGINELLEKITGCVVDSGGVLELDHKVYLDEEEEEDDENNHSNGNVVKRGITRISRSHRALFLSFLGDRVREHIGLKILSWKKRYFDVDLTFIKLVMNRLGQLLRNFIRRVTKDGQFPDDEIRSVGDKLKEIKDRIKEGTLKVDHGTDAMTVVLGKEKGGYARGVGSEVTYKRYFDLPQSKKASDERIALLQSKLDNERCERQGKELEIQNLSKKMTETKGMLIKLMNQLAAQGEQLQSMSIKLTPSDVSPVDINPIDNNADKEGGTPISVVGCENDASI
nr:hypothetical protein [Tanacetum cinerariifolium]